MKKILFVFTIALGAISVQAQEFSIGPSVGVSHSWMNNEVEGDDESKGITGFNVGLILNYSTNEKIGVGTAIHYSEEGIVMERNGLEATTKLKYVRVPLKLYYYFNELEDDFRPKIYAGPSMGFLVGGKTEQFTGNESGTVELNAKDVYEPFDIGILFGTGFNYRIAQRTWLNLDVAYTHGLTDVQENVIGKNRNILANVGIAWGF
jgi:outer membrane protein W